MKRYLLLFLLASCLCNGIFSANAEEKLIVSDFSDVSTWRIIGTRGVPHGSWFAADINLGSVADSSRDDGYTGAFKYLFGGQTPYHTAYHRYKVFKAAEVYASAIEFWGNPNGRAGEIRFTIQDSKNKKYDIQTVPVIENIWKKYRVEINKDTVKNYSKIEFPVRLKAVTLVMNTPGKGLFYIDDIALCGNISNVKKLSLTPIYESLYHLPNKPVKLSYFASNATPKELPSDVSLDVLDYDGKKIFSTNQKVSISPYERKKISFTLPVLPIGPYLCELKIQSGKIQGKNGDWFGVFTPNNGRKNKSGMLFGAQDGNLTQCDEETKLHLDWMKLMGADINRFATAGTFLDFDIKKGDADNGTKRILDMHKENDIDVCLSYIEGVPQSIIGRGKHRREPVPRDKEVEFAKHIEEVAGLFSKYPNVTHLEWRNEPDIGFYYGTIDDYLNELKILKETLVKSGSDIKVTTGGVCVKHPREKKNFSKDMFQKGKDYFDVAAFHSHGSTKTYKRLNNVVEKWLEESGQNKTVCNTEAGERSGYFNLGAARYQCESLVKKITFAKSRKTEFYMWFMLQDYWDMDFNADDSFGLVTSENRPKPSFLSYNTLINQLGDTTFAKEQMILDPNLESYHFVTNNNEEDVFVCWSKNKGSQVSVQLSGKGKVTTSTIFGDESVNESTGNFPVSILVGNTPSYIRFKRGEFKVWKESFVSLPAELFMEENEERFIPVTIKNIFGSKFNFVVSKIENDSETILTRLELNPGEEATQNVFWNMIPNVKSRKVRVKVVEKDKSFDFPVNIQKAYSVNLLEKTSYFPMGEMLKLKTISLDKLKDVHEMTYDPSIKGWDGKDDLSVTCTLAHDKKNLYFYYEVTDDKHAQKDTGVNIWRGDGIQIGLADNSGKHWEFTMALTPKGAQAWCHMSPGNSINGALGTPVDIERVKNKTVYKLTLPFEKLGWEYQPNTPFRFAFLVNEDDGKGRIRWIHYHEGIGGDKNADLFGHALLK